MSDATHDPGVILTSQPLQPGMWVRIDGHEVGRLAGRCPYPEARDCWRVTVAGREVHVSGRSLMPVPVGVGQAEEARR